MIVAGVGCKKGASEAAIEVALRAALEAAGVAPDKLEALATHATKQDEPGLVALAARWGLRLLSFTTAEMQTLASSVETVSQRVVELKGVPSVAEAAALTAAGPSSRLLAARVTTSEAACAIAEGAGSIGGSGDALDGSRLREES